MGSIVHLDNARVASILDLDMVLVVNGGLGTWGSCYLCVAIVLVCGMKLVCLSVRHVHISVECSVECSVV